MAATYLYLMRCLTYGSKHPIKIGITKNVEKRCEQWRSTGLCTVVLGYFRFESKHEATRLEALVRSHFPMDPHYGVYYSREVLDASMTEILEFLRERTDHIFCLVEC